MMLEAVHKLLDGKDLTLEEAQSAMAEIFSGSVSPVLIAAFLTALRMKGETVDEIAGAAKAMRGASKRAYSGSPVVVDTCGTGGDRKGSFNISTAAALVVAGAGFTVAKHGNRSVSSLCGSADVLEALGVKIDPPIAVAERCLKEAGIAFLFAPLYHPAMKHAMPVRKELGTRTIFNVLGPLCNPACAHVQAIGVFSDPMLDTMARVLVRLGARHSVILHGNGHDEITLQGTSRLAEIVNGKVTKRFVSAKDFGLKPSPESALKGGTREDNALIIRAVLGGKKGPRRDVVVANAAVALLSASRAAGRKEVTDLKSAARAAEIAIDSGAAREKLEKLAVLSQQAL